MKRILVWEEVVELIDFAFQPIVSMHTGLCFGVEALLRDYERAGFTSIRDLFNTAYEEKMLIHVDKLLREKAISKFLNIEVPNLKLFFNLDNRMVKMPDFTPNCFNNVHNILPSNLCFELSEQDKWGNTKDYGKLLDTLNAKAHQIALDDFGSGFAGLQVLYNSEPNFVKIDRFFISGIDKDARKKLFVSNIINLTTILGIKVIAEGVETIGEYYACRDIGCDFVQGFLVKRPTQIEGDILSIYYELREWNNRQINFDSTDTELIREKSIYINAIVFPRSEISDIFDHFRRYKNHSYIPIINESLEPIGIIHEVNLKEYVYSPFGRDLLKNMSLGKSIINFITKVPIVDINTSLEKIIKAYSVNGFDGECILITENGKYYGIITAKTLLNALNEKNIAVARDLNPLTKLPGNIIINEYISSQLINKHMERSLVYFDIDNFKPFNDRYGFRVGDRVIMLFSDILKRHKLQHDEILIGHIGGDDFFLGYESLTPKGIENIAMKVTTIKTEFQEAVKSLYSQEDRENGFIIAKDRSGSICEFPLITVSAAMIFFPHKTIIKSDEEFNKRISLLKSEAKNSPLGFASFSL